MLNQIHRSKGAQAFEGNDNWVINKRVEMIESLKESILRAGDHPKQWVDLKDMTVECLVTLYAQNDIQFRYVGKEK